MGRNPDTQDQAPNHLHMSLLGRRVLGNLRLSYTFWAPKESVLNDVTQFLSSQAFGFKENISIHLNYKVLYKNEVLVTENEISSSLFSIMKCSVSNFVHFEVLVYL